MLYHPSIALPQEQSDHKRSPFVPRALAVGKIALFTRRSEGTANTTFDGSIMDGLRLYPSDVLLIWNGAVSDNMQNEDSY